MKRFKEYLKEASPTNSGGNPQAYSNAADVEGPVAGLDLLLFPQDDELLSQDYQTPAEVGLNKWRFSNIYPVMKVTLDDNKGDGPSIDAMVDASKEYTDIMDKNVQDTIKKNYSRFMGEAKENLTCPVGMKYDKTKKIDEKNTHNFHFFDEQKYVRKKMKNEQSEKSNIFMKKEVIEKRLLI